MFEFLIVRLNISCEHVFYTVKTISVCDKKTTVVCIHTQRSTTKVLLYHRPLLSSPCLLRDICTFRKTHPWSSRPPVLSTTRRSGTNDNRKPSPPTLRTPPNVGGSLTYCRLDQSSGKVFSQQCLRRSRRDPKSYFKNTL